MNLLKSTFAFLLLLAIIASCKKDHDTEMQSPSGNSIEVTLSGQVIDETGQPLKDVLITIGSEVARSDGNGIFLMKKIEVNKGRVFVSASKSGYFKSGRNIIPENGATMPVVIMMLPKTITGKISAVNGGSITTNGLEVSLPANAIKGGYSGEVSIATHVFDPTSDQFILEIPGSLDAINSSGEEVGLRSYAMANIELLGDQGQALQLEDGKNASLKFPIAASDLASAPNEIPLWYFDDEEGIWKEDGQATRNGSVYEGEVSHFTPWNCDLSRFEIIIRQKVRCDTNAVKGAILKMIDNSDGSVIGLAFTNSKGVYNAPLPENASIEIRLVQNYGNSFCDSDLGDITTGSESETKPDLVACPDQMTITGSVVDCDNQPITNGYVYGSIGSFNTLGAILDASGSFSLSTYYCPGASDLQLTAWDISTLSNNTDTELSISSKVVNLSAPIVICDAQVNISNIAYFEGPGDKFLAVNRTTGSTVWQTDPGNGIQSRSTAFDNGIFFLENGNNEFCAINAADGSILWKKSILPASHVPIADNGVVYIGSSNGNIYALNGTSGDEIWNYDTDGNGGNSVILASSPTLHNGVLYVGTSTTKVIGLDINNGSLVWNFSIDEDAVYTNPAVNGDLLLVTSSGRKGILYAIDLIDSSEVWRVAINDYLADPVTDESRVFVHVDNALNAYNLDDGSLAWSYSIGGDPVGSSVTTAPFVDNGKVYVGGRDGKMKCINATSGALIWEYAVSAGIVDASPTIADGILYFSGTHFDEKVYALNASDGSELWTSPLPGGGGFRDGMVVIDQNGIPHFSGLSGEVQ